MHILAADHVLPISAGPIRDGAVIIDGTRIVDVGPREAIAARYPDAPIDDLGKAAIIPGLVNCHSHLEVTAMRGALDDVEHDFRSWLLKLNDLREAMSNEELEAAALSGAVEGVRAGVTCFGDIGRYGRAGMAALKKAGLRGVLFQETEFSPDDRTAVADFSELRDKYEGLRAEANDLIEVGISPHSPYTVSRRLLELITEYALAENIKISIHAAESAQEDRLMTHGEGFFTEIYAKFGVEWKRPHCSTIEFLKETGILRTRPLLAHCVIVTEQDIDIIADSGSRIAHCPKSNAKFGHGYAPFERFLDAGISVGLGSDSVASNNVCDILEESRFAALAARNRPGRSRFISAREALQTATIGGARALGLEDRIGTLEPGKAADLAVVSLAHPGQQPLNDVEAAIVFSSNARDVLATVVAGKYVYDSREEK
jgi:5-methylthioadenosine/S-adenosylhomocysteine deaminase